MEQFTKEILPENRYLHLSRYLHIAEYFFHNESCNYIVFDKFRELFDLGRSFYCAEMKTLVQISQIPMKYRLIYCVSNGMVHNLLGWCELNRITRDSDRKQFVLLQQ